MYCTVLPSVKGWLATAKHTSRIAHVPRVCSTYLVDEHLPRYLHLPRGVGLLQTGLHGKGGSVCSMFRENGNCFSFGLPGL